MSTATPTFSTMSESLVTQPTLPDVCRRPQFKMADYKPEVQYCSGAQWYIIKIPQLSRNPEMSSSARGSLTIDPHIRKTWQFVLLLKLIFYAVENYADMLRKLGFRYMASVKFGLWPGLRTCQKYLTNYMHEDTIVPNWLTCVWLVMERMPSKFIMVACLSSIC